MRALAAVVSAGLLFGLTGCPDKSQKESIKLNNEATRSYGGKHYDTAIDQYKKAVETWADNHMAWYGLAAAYNGKSDWSNAADAMANAVRIAPEQPMYHLVYGHALYNKAIHQAREDQARRENKKPEEVQLDLTGINFERALQHLQKAVELNPDLWRAHYNLGRIYRDTDRPKEAAEALTKALSYGPTDDEPWVALAEIYRKWDYTDQALQVAQQGAAVVPGSNEVADLWFVVGMSYDDKRMHDKAIEAFDKALESRADHHKAKFQRGQALFWKGDYAKAKKDLETFAKSGGLSVEFEKQQAQKMLLDIAAKSATQQNAAESG